MLPPSATSSSNRENDTSRPASPPLPSSRRGSPKSRSHRSGSVESRTSDRSRRDRSGRDRDRDRGDTAKVNGPAGDSDRKKQEDLLQARHDRLAAEPGVKDERRSSGSKRESTKERAERKAKEQEEKDKDGKDEAGQKRKRDEAVSYLSGQRIIVQPADLYSHDVLTQSRSRVIVDESERSGTGRGITDEIEIVTAIGTEAGTETAAVIAAMIPAIATGGSTTLAIEIGIGGAVEMTLGTEIERGIEIEIEIDEAQTTETKGQTIELEIEEIGQGTVVES
jgi:hypothetical protein